METDPQTQRIMVAREGVGVGVLGEKGEGIRSTNWYLLNSHGI